MDTPEGRIELEDYYQTKVLTHEDVERLLDDYYDERGWEITRGVPTREKLQRLGLQVYVGLLEAAPTKTTEA
jgi:aldehyde:ferredoxin oxidoreductase